MYCYTSHLNDILFYDDDDDDNFYLIFYSLCLQTVQMFIDTHDQMREGIKALCSDRIVPV